MEWLGLLLAMAAVLLPFGFVTDPPLHDYPFHLARMRILQSLGSGDYFDAIYRLNTWLLPNAAMDAAFQTVLRHVDDVRLAGLLFVGAVQVLTVGGVAYLRWTLHRSLGLAPLLAAIAVHNWIFLLGFLNYLFGVALFLWCLAFWIRQMEGPAPARLAVGALSAMALFFCHFLAFGLFALAVSALEIQRAFERRGRDGALARLASTALPWIPPLAVFALLSPTGREGGTTPLADWFRSLDLASKPGDLLQSLLSGVFWIDLVTLGAIVPALIAAALLFRRGHAHLDRRMLLALAALLLLPLATPHALFGAYFIDFRLLLPFVYVAIGSLRLQMPRPRWCALWGIGTALLVAGRAAAFSATWAAYGETTDRFFAAFRALPKPATLYVAMGMKSPVMSTRLGIWAARWNPPLKHVVSMASLVGEIYVPATWAHPAQHPIVVRERFRASYDLQGQNPVEIVSADALRGFLAQIQAAGRAGAHPAGAALLLVVYPEGVAEMASLAALQVAFGPGFVILEVPAGELPPIGAARRTP